MGVFSSFLFRISSLQDSIASILLLRVVLGWGLHAGESPLDSACSGMYLPCKGVT